MTTINELIALTAQKYLGKREKPNNAGFVDAEFEKRMAAVGFIKGQSWCAYFSELVWSEAYFEYDPQRGHELSKIFSASATSTYKNFDINPGWEVSKVPVVGALAVWRHGLGWQGHIGIVFKLGDKNFQSIEGNTNSEGGREGIEVALKTRALDYKIGDNKLNLIGFVIPKSINLTV